MNSRLENCLLIKLKVFKASVKKSWCWYTRPTWFFTSGFEVFVLADGFMILLPSVD